MDIKFYADAIRKGDDPAAVLGAALAVQRRELVADIDSSRPINDDEPYRQGMNDGIDRAIYRIRNPERLDASS